MKITNVILAGGTGTRLWPLSTQKEPKQFLKLIENQSLFQKTAERNSPFTKKYLVIGNEYHENLVSEQIKRVDLHIKFEILSESIGRNTAAAIAFAALNENKETILFITPSDHLIEDQDQYENSIGKAISLAMENKLVTFGIHPTSPDTGFGYIQYNKEQIIEFKEKPDIQTAESYLKTGDYLWNSGMFMFKAGVYLDELKLHSPQIYEASLEAFNKKTNGIIPKDLSMRIPDISIDYAVMEKTKNSSVIKSDFFWTDLGSYDSLVDYYEKKDKSIQESNVKRINTTKEIYWLGDEEIIYVEKDNKILILPRGESQEVKNLHNRIKSEKPDLL